MAWYELYKWFFPWRKNNYINRINWYRNYLYYEWFNSLSDEDKNKELYRIKELKQKREREGEQARARLNAIFNTINYATNGKMMDIMKIASDVNKISVHPSKYW